MRAALVLGWWLLGLAAVTVHAEPDPVELELRQRYPVPLRWDNVAGKPLWLAGPSPRYDLSRGFHRVRLAPGESTLLRVPALEFLRLYRPARALTRNDIRIEVSDGSGLYASMPAQRAQDGHTLLLPGDWPQTRIVRIARPAAATDPIELALYISRHEPLDDIAPYRDSISLPAPTVRLRQEQTVTFETFWSLTPGEPVSIKLQGPAYLALEHRLRYPPRETPLHRTYRVYTRLNGRPWRGLEFETRFETTRTVFIDGCAESLGRLETGYLEIPEGEHKLTLDTTAPLYGRLLRRAQPDYLFADLNGPKPAILPQAISTEPRGSVWELDAHTAARQLLTGTLRQRERAALRLAWDNRYRDGPLTAAMALRQAVPEQRHAPEINTLAQELLGLHTFYRPLLPFEKTSTAHQRFAWFAPRHLKSLSARDRSLVTGEPQAEALLGFLASGYFLELGTGLPLEYRLPERKAPTLLRIAVDRSSLPSTADNGFWIRFDDGHPLPLRVTGKPELDEDAFLPGLGEAGLVLLGKRHGQTPTGTLAAPFGALKSPAPFLKVATLELWLPPRINRIQVGGAQAPLRLALQYRASKPHQLSEQAYRETVRRLAEPRVYRELLQQLTHEENSETIYPFLPAAENDPETFALSRDLANHRLPLVRLLQSRARLLRAAVAKPGAAPAPGVSRAVRSLSRQAQRHEKTGHWLPALETWSRVAHGATNRLRRQALLAQARVLFQLGEHFLAENLLRGLFLHDSDETLRQRALARLAGHYREIRDWDALQTLLSTAAVEHPEAAILRDLVAVLVHNGQHDLALTLGLALPTGERPLPDLLRAAYLTGWWETFEALLPGLTDPPSQRLWRGYRAHRQGRYAQAMEHWRHAGNTGRRLTDALLQGLDIRQALGADAQETRLAAIPRWETWQARHPGFHTWSDAAHLITDYAGAETLYSPERDLFSLAFRATPVQPVRLRVQGPVQLQVKGRLLHPRDISEPADGWLMLRDGPRVERLPINGDRPGQSLRLVGNPAQLPGLQVTLEYAVGPGLHDIAISGGRLPLLVQLAAWRPEQPLLVLPVLTGDTVAAAVQRQATAFRPNPVNRGIDGWQAPPLQSIHQCRATSWPNPLISRALPVNPETAWEIDRRLPAHRSTAPKPAAPTVMPGAALRDQFHRWLWQIEQHPHLLPGILPQAEQLFADNPRIPGLPSLRRRLTRGTRWQHLLNIEQSAGIRYIELTGWQPQTPLLRIRKALLPPLPPDELLLLGDQELGLAMVNPQATTLHINLKMEDVGYLPPQPMRVFYRLDDHPEHTLELQSRTSTRRLALAIPEGEHVVSFRIERPPANQYLRLRIRERNKTAAGSIARDLKRLYHIATHDEPLRTRISGPAWVRIDERRGDTLVSRHRSFGPGWHILELTPGPGETEALYRIHQRIVTDRDRSSPPRTVKWELNPVPPAPGEVPEAAPAAEIRLLDAYAPSGQVKTGYPPGDSDSEAPPQASRDDGHTRLGQEDGTWSLAAGWVWPKPLEESTDGAGNGESATEEYLEISTGYRYGLEYRDLYWQAQGLYRHRAQGDPTWGLKGSLYYRPDRLPVTLRLSWEGFIQDRAWSSTFRGGIEQLYRLGPKTHHSPRLSFFERHLHQDEDFIFRSRAVDQDVFTEFKLLHPRGLILADTLTHRPWLDTLWQAGISLTSDEDWDFFTPEHLTVELGWKQLLQDVQVDVDYRWIRYFAQDGHFWRRPEASDQREVAGRILWDHGRAGQGRLQVGLEIRYELRSEDFGAHFSLTWFPDNGRGYRDFRPGSVDFRDLRQRRLPLNYNNRIEPLPGPTLDRAVYPP